MQLPCAKAGHGRSDIAKLMDLYKSTIGRELKRNLGKQGCRPKQAHDFSQARIRACENGHRVADDTWLFVDAKLAEFWSLEQITGYLKANSMPTVSHESIYQRTYANKRVGGILHRALRRRKHYVWRLRATRHSPQSSVD